MVRAWRCRPRYNAGVKWEIPAFDLRLFAVSVLAFLSFWYWARHVYIPANTAEVHARKLPTGNNSDLYSRWLGARELLLRGRDPYTPEMTREIQTGFYGRPLDPQKESDPRAQEAFVYPLWVVFLLAPSVTLPFGHAVHIFRWILVGSVGLGAVLWMYVMGFRRRPVLVLAVVVFVLSSLPCLVEYYQQNLTSAVILFLALAAFCIARNWFAAGGFLLALATMKPDTTGIPILWFLIWAASKWKNRRLILWAFTATIAVFVLLSEMLLPHWVAGFIAQIREYPSYGTAPNPLQLVFGQVPGTVLSVMALFLLLALWFRWRTADADTSQFRWAIAWTCMVALAIIPKIAAYNQLLLMPPLLILLMEYRSIQQGRILQRALAKAPLACLFLHWLAAAVLSLAALLDQRIVFSRYISELPDHIFLATAPLTLLAVTIVTFSSARAELLPNLQTANEAA